jgi:hypothetical protein
MTKQKSLLSFAFLALFGSLTHAVLIVPQPEHFNTNTSQTSPLNSTMSDARALIRARGRRQAFALRGGRNAVEIAPRLPRDGGSPIASYLSTLHDANSTTDYTITTFTQVRPTDHASHSITVRQKHVNNVCGGLNSLCKTKSPILLYTTFAPDSLAEQWRNLLNYNNIFKLQKTYTRNFFHRYILDIKPPLILGQYFFNNSSIIFNLHYNPSPEVLSDPRLSAEATNYYVAFFLPHNHHVNLTAHTHLNNLSTIITPGQSQ